MRNLSTPTTLALLAPLALLAACGKSETAAPAEATVIANTAAPATAPEPAMVAVANARTAVQWPGTYSGTVGGASVNLTLNPDLSYSWTSTPAAGTPTSVSGTFSWYRDGGRILLDAAAGKAIYAVGDGVLFKMADKDAPVTGPLARDTALVRTVAPVAPAAR